MIRTILIFIFLFAVSISAFSQQQVGTNIRGRVITESEYYQSYIPVNSVNVDLYWNNGQDWQIIDRAISDQYGYYFFYNLYPGVYFIQVNGNKNFKIEVYQIDSRYQFLDIADLYY